MANILMIGDSWGLSPYWSPMNPIQNEPYTEHRLFELGHMVWNKSEGGGQNIRILQDCDFYLRNVYHHVKFDLIIWFHTEMVRDIHSYNNDKKFKGISLDSIEGQLEYVKNITYELATNIKQDFPEIKWAIIGGHAPIMTPEQLSWADFLIEDWRSEIVGKKLPACQTLSGLDWLQQNIDTFGPNAVQQELDNYETIVRECSTDVNKFYDGVHPTGLYHRQLADRIHNYFFSTR